MVCERHSTVFPSITSIMTLTISPPSSGCFLLCFIPPIIISTRAIITTTTEILTINQTTAHSPTITVIHGTASVWILEYIFMTSYPEPIAPIITPKTPNHMNKFGMASKNIASLFPVLQKL